MARVKAYGPNRSSLPQGSSARFRPAQTQGSAIGEALQNTGQNLANYAARQDQLDAQFDESEARRIGLEYQAESARRVSAYGQEQGINAINGRADLEKGLTQLKDDSIKQASGSDRMKFLTKQRIDRLYASDVYRVGNHAVGELKKHTIDTLNTQATQSREAALESWTDPQLLGAHIDTGLSAIDQLGSENGWSEEITAYEREKWESGVHRSIVDQMLVGDDISAAEAYFEAHRGNLSGKDELAIAGDLKAPLERRQAANDFTLATGMLPDAGDGSNFSYNLPLSGGRETSKYNEKRANGPHNGIDIAAPVGTAIRSMAPGKVIKVAEDSRSGKYVVVQHADGHTTSYSHMKNQNVNVDDAVGASTVLGVVGVTGETTGPHVHVVARRNGKTIDPNSLVGKTGNAPRQWDKAQVYSNIEETGRKENWSFERIERVKKHADQEISRDEQLFARRERASAREASEIVLELGDNFTSLNQIPRAVRDNMSPSALQTYTNAAERNAAPKAVKANGETAITLKLLEIMEPDKFSQMNLGEYVGKVSPGELSSLVLKQAKINKDSGKDYGLRPGITSTINVLATEDMELMGRANREDYIEVVNTMDAILNGVTQGKRKATTTELDEAFRMATREVKTSKTFIGIPTGSGERRVFELEIDNVPASEKERLSAKLKSINVEPTDDNILEAFQIEKAQTQ